FGIVLTLVPWILLALGLTFLGNQAPRTTSLSPRLDVINAIITFIISAIIEGAFVVAPLLIAIRAYHSLPSRWKLGLQALGFRKFNALQALGLLFVLIIAILAIDNLYQYVISLFHWNLQTNDQVLLQEGQKMPYTTYATLLVAVFVAPFCEEIFFRGFIFMGLRRAMPVGIAIVASSFLFAIAHADLGSFAVLFIIGIVLAFIRWRTRSLWPGIFLHMLNNGIGALVVVLAINGIIKP
ncbi:MAG TPA: CPBP family intramembrane glutamic endopeptidase, partial [Ktedonobacteraceae bacterium]|nr:CPBP family intramembrane glutamic endopeptidase [Ktedonobacteraceae bacterium]